MLTGRVDPRVRPGLLGLGRVGRVRKITNIGRSGRVQEAGDISGSVRVGSRFPWVENLDPRVTLH